MGDENKVFSNAAQAKRAETGTTPAGSTLKEKTAAKTAPKTKSNSRAKKAATAKIESSAQKTPNANRGGAKSANKSGAQKTPVMALRRIDPADSAESPEISAAARRQSAHSVKVEGDSIETAAAPGPETVEADTLESSEARKSSHEDSEITPREAMIREAAYFKAEKRRFEPGFETDDWFEAEREVDAKIGR